MPEQSIAGEPHGIRIEGRGSIAVGSVPRRWVFDPAPITGPRLVSGAANPSTATLIEEVGPLTRLPAGPAPALSPD